MTAEERRQRMEALNFAMDCTVNGERYDCFCTLQEMYYELMEAEKVEGDF